MALSFICDSCGNAADYFITLKVNRHNGTVTEIRTIHRTDSCTDDLGELVVETLQLKEGHEFGEFEVFRSIEISEIGVDDATEKDIITN